MPKRWSPQSDPSHAGGSSTRRALARFRRSQEGATAVEFGILALPFLFLMFAILEIAMVFWTTQVLETAVAAAARQIYTGQFQTDSGNANKTPAQLAQKFKDALCANVTGLFNCTAVAVDIRNYSYSSGSAPTGVNNRTYDTSGFGYQSVGPNQIALVTAAMEYPVIVKLVGGSTLSNGNRLIMASTTFRTEPYSN